MNDSVFRVLEYEQIKKKLAAKAVSDLGKGLCADIAPKFDIDDIKLCLLQTDEAVSVLLTAAHVPLAGFFDVRSAAHRALLGAILDPHELLKIAQTMNVVRRMKTFLSELEGDYNYLQEMTYRIMPQKFLEEAITNAVDDSGEIRDSASHELNKIRKEMRVLRSRIKEKIDSLVRSQENHKYFSDAVVTMRNDRYVIPVKQEYRSQFPGIVHDTSGSGATVFIEPMAIVNINNDLKQLESKEKHEIERILTALSLDVGRFSDAITESCVALSELDFVFAKGKLALELKATLPELTSEKCYRLRKARHPLIDSKCVVPIDVVFGTPNNLLLITGPNTGGKTVTLKTIGLLTLMAQSGLFIPADSGSKLPYYTDVYVDIGDEQSIEQNLSTFSGHMRNVTRIIENVCSGDLVLFDEIGAGTDPEEGAALAQSILEQLIAVNCVTVATTHYGALKNFGYNNESVKNASVEFDINTLSPTYRLLIGVPGSSNAFAISKRLGLDESVIDRAKQLVSHEHTALENVLGKIDADMKQANDELLQVKILREQTERINKEAKAKLDAVTMKRDELVEKARKEAGDIVRRARAEAEYVIAELRKIQTKNVDKQQDEINAMRKLLVETQQKIEVEEQSDKFDTYDGEITAGKNVFIASLNQAGIVESISGNNALVQIGALKTTIALKKLKLVRNRAEARAITARTFTGEIAMRTVQRTLDIRGKMVEEVLPDVDKFLDDGVMSGLNELMLIHGKGTGALRSGIRDHLKQHPHVKSISIAEYNEGGNGATLIKLN
ncbi:MAG: endonuclease MutS2 [Negativicutes bacterium]|jgi:DNA mismatch repair protein MutS2